MHCDTVYRPTANTGTTLSGWEQTVDYLKTLGYEVVCIDQHVWFGVEGHWNDTRQLILLERISFHCLQHRREGLFPLTDRD